MRGWQSCHDYPADRLGMRLAQELMMHRFNFMDCHAAFASPSPSHRGIIDIVIGLFGALEEHNRSLESRRREVLWPIPLIPRPGGLGLAGPDAHASQLTRSRAVAFRSRCHRCW